ncbi:MAG: flotillin [Candidatus Kapabacteria bacterium]|nr:flotillin [Candidatus Kapabacteria bacterium]
MEEFVSFLFSVGGITFVGFFFLLIFIKKLLIICHPNEIVILSGRKRSLPDGSIVGYRIIRGGRALRIPIIEKAARMSLEVIPIELHVSNCYSKGGIPLTVNAIANIKIDSKEPTLGNSVERFLGMKREEILQIAKDTLEGNLRGVLASLTPEEVNEDRLKFAHTLIDEAEDDLKQLGLQLDTLKIQNVVDEAGYLDSIGRRKTAEVLAQARTAEAERQSEAERAEAVSRQEAEVAKAKSELAIKNAQIDKDREIRVNQTLAQQQIEIENNNLRVKKAELEKISIIKENEAQIAGEITKVKYEQEMEQERIALQQRRLMADVIEPARAKKEATELEAKAQAALILESGNANLEIFKRTTELFQKAGSDAERIMILNMFPKILEQLTSVVQDVNIDRISVIDNGGQGSDGSGLSKVINQLPSAVVNFGEVVKNATGIDIFKQLQDSKTPDTKE